MFKEPIVQDFYEALDGGEPVAAEIHPEPKLGWSWRDAVAAVTQRILDESTGLERGRVEQARAIVLDGGVRIEGLPHPLVADGTERYTIERDVCRCEDYRGAPMQACRHRIALRLYKKSRQFAEALFEREQSLPAPYTPCPEALVSVNASKSGGIMITLRCNAYDEAPKLVELAKRLLEQPPAGAGPAGSSYDRSNEANALAVRSTASSSPARGARPEPDDVPFGMDDLPPDDDYDEAWAEAELAPNCHYHRDRPMLKSKFKGVEWYCNAKDNGEFCRFQISKDGKKVLAKAK